MGRLAVPETLRLDLARLHGTQNDFQRCVVLAVCLLLLRQSMQSAGQAAPAAHIAGAKRRLGAILADPAMRLPDLAAELNNLAGERGALPCHGCSLKMWPGLNVPVK